MLKKCLLGLAGAVAVLFFQSPARAGWFDNIPLLPGQQRETYKVSDVQPIDVERFCANHSPGYSNAHRDGDGIVCESGTKISGNVTGNVGVVGGTGNFERSQISRYPITELCDWKHPGIGAFAGDGGGACYDSYRH